MSVAYNPKRRISRLQLSAEFKESVRTEIGRFVLMLIGITLGSLGYVLFQVPNNIAAGGITGIALMVVHYTGWQLGITYWILNIPMIILGYFVLDRWRFVFKTLIASTLFSILTDFFVTFLPQVIDPYPITDNLVLATIYGGIIGGLGGGLIFMSGSTLGGTGVLARVVQKHTGLPLSQVYLMDDGLIILALGMVFGWENALFGMMMLLLNGMATDYAMEGASTTRTVTVVTKRPEEMTESLFRALNKGVSYWPVTGGYSHETHHMLVCTIYRTQMSDVKAAVAAVDPDAFVTIGIGHYAMGEGFTPLKRK